MSSERHTITGILTESRQDGDAAALDELLPLVYDELRTLAHRQRRRLNAGETMNTTALVHETYLKLVNKDRVDAEGRAHFFALAARAMRQILTDYARAQRTRKRGSGKRPVPLHEVADLLAEGPVLAPEHIDTLAELDDALRRLESMSERQSRVVECRFYGGMSIPETATALGVSMATVKRDWTLAQAWLYRELRCA